VAILPLGLGLPNGKNLDVGAFGETAPETTISFNNGSNPHIHHPAIL